MEKNIKQLQKEFERISKKGYIKGIYNTSSSVGRTFENELNLSRNTMEIPDYNGIEIKTRRTYSKSYITLFSAVPNGRGNQEIERLKNIYGYPYKKDKRYKALYVDVYGNTKKYGGIKYQYKLEVDRKEQKLYLCIYDRFDNLIERKTYWSFIYLESKISLKLETLAIINAWDTTKEGWNYFKYYKIDFYKIKNFETFLNLVEEGVIRMNIKVDIKKDEKNYGKTYDHGCGFGIKEEDVPKLYNKIILK